MGNNRNLYKDYTMSKYKGIILEVLDSKRFLSTNGVVRTIKREKKKTANWYLIYSVLQELAMEGKIEKAESDQGFMWKLKEEMKKRP